MKHARCQTSVTRTPPLPTQCSTYSNPGHVLSPEPAWSRYYPYLIHGPCSQISDFQSNGRAENDYWSIPPLTGLGIHCTEPPCFHDYSTQEDPLKTACVSTHDYAQGPGIDWHANLNFNDFKFVSATGPEADDTTGIQTDCIVFDSPPRFFSSFLVHPNICPGKLETVDHSTSRPNLTSSWSMSSISSLSCGDIFNDEFFASPGCLDESFKLPGPLLPDLSTPPMALPIADINMFSAVSLDQESSTGVNPSDIMPLLKEEPTFPTSLACSSCSNSDLVLSVSPSDSLTEAVSSIFAVLSAAEARRREESPPNNISFEAYTERVPDFEPYCGPTSPEAYLSTLPSQPTLPPSSPSVYKDRPNIPTKNVDAELENSWESYVGRSRKNTHSIIGSPILDAHRGISLTELQAKAEKYKEYNPGEEIDKRWLLSFAGKLSERGELLDEYRCYVIGCQQINKRRDHILIHIGAHVGQRPFKCSQCPSSFLRKNECKRHELSHTGTRPYTCQLCPFEGTSFVRLDLLRRHQKRAHDSVSKAEKENMDYYGGPPCKKVRRA